MSACLRPDGVLEITLDRPEAGNRFDAMTLAALSQAFARAGEAGVRAVLFTHEGDVFCLGGNLGDARAQHAGTVARFGDALVGALRAIYYCPVPVLAAVEGDCEGGGLSFVEACAMAAASESARFSIPEILSGMSPVVSFSGAYQVAPEKRLMEMALLGEKMGAREAERVGLITRAVRPGEAKATCEAWIRAMASAPPAAIRLILDLRRRMNGHEFDRQLDAARDLLISIMMHKDTWDMLDRREGDGAR